MPEVKKTIADVHRAIAAGVSIPTAIREALGISDTAFAKKHGIARSTFTNSILGNFRATDDVIVALVAELGGTEDEWRHLLWEAARPVRATA